MNTLNDLVNNNPYLNFVFLFLAILGIVATLITYLRSRRIKNPVFGFDNYKLVSDSLSKLGEFELRFEKKVISQFSVCHLSILNIGKKAIRKSDIANNDKLRVIINNGKILKYEILYIHNHVNNIVTHLNNESTTINIDFDYLGFHDGIVLEIYHTSIKDSDITVAGTFIESKKLNKIDKEFGSSYYFNSLMEWTKTGGILSYFKLALMFPVLVILLFHSVYKIMITKIPKSYINIKKNWI